MLSFRLTGKEDISEENRRRKEYLKGNEIYEMKELCRRRERERERERNEMRKL